MQHLLDSISRQLSLEPQDDRLKNALQESFLANLIALPYRLISQAIQKIGNANLQKLGSIFQLISFVITAATIFSLWLPKFASEKDTLAYVFLLSLILYMSGSLLGGKEKRQVSAVDSLVVLFLGVNLVAACASRYFRQSSWACKIDRLCLYLFPFFSSCKYSQTQIDLDDCGCRRRSCGSNVRTLSI
jgi:hypothetical protein